MVQQSRGSVSARAFRRDVIDIFLLKKECYGYLFLFRGSICHFVVPVFLEINFGSHGMMLPDSRKLLISAQA